MSPDSRFVLAVALVTWGGLWLYLLRLELMVKAVKKQISEPPVAAPPIDPVPMTINPSAES